MRVVWSPLALQRVAEAAEFIARDRPRAAGEWVETIFASVERIERFPQSGRRVTESRRTDLREVVHGNHRVIYRVEPDRLVVLTVRHARQDLCPEAPDLS